MVSPFPGMDPYLENPEFWSEVHHRLITAIAITIAPFLRPKYRVAIEKRTYMSGGEDALLVGISDGAILSEKAEKKTPKSSTITLPYQSESTIVTLPQPLEIREGYLEIKEVATGKVVTVIEILSPTNKRAGKGREKYVNKRLNILASPTHLVEIDLLRSGKPMTRGLSPLLSAYPKTDYRVLVARGNRRPQAQLYAFSVREELPKFLLPLQPNDSEPLVDLQSLFRGVYERAGFDLTIDYTQAPLPPLKPEDQLWYESLLHEKGLG